MNERKGVIRLRKYIIGSTLALTVALVGAASVGAATLTNSGNGYKSVNLLSSTNKNITNVWQGNSANVSNVVGVTNNSGGNKANKNTGGAVTVTTGTTDTGVALQTNANTNAADVSNCGCAGNGADVLNNTGNGAKSYNSIYVKDINKTSVAQSNAAQVLNVVTTHSSTGNNQANSNTGGNVNVGSGDATTTVVVENNLNVNEAVVGGGL